MASWGGMVHSVAFPEADLRKGLVDPFLFVAPDPKGFAKLPTSMAPSGGGEVAQEEERLPQAMLFAGDGSQRVGMLQAVKDLPAVRQKLNVAKELLGYDVLDLCLNGPAEKLESLEYNGVVMYMAGWAAYELFLQQDPANASKCRAVAGVDVGEYTALAVAGVLPFEVGLELAHVRGKAMQDVAQKVPDQACCSVAGLGEERVKQLCDLAIATAGGGGQEHVCQLTTALFNKGYIVGGHTKMVNAFKDLATKDGAMQAKVLPGQKANHSTVMRPAHWTIKSKLHELRDTIRAPRYDVYFNADPSCCLRAGGPGSGGPDQNVNDVAEEVSRLLCMSCWTACRWDLEVQALINAGIKKFFECGPTKQLKGLMKRIDKVASENTSNFEV